VRNTSHVANGGRFRARLYAMMADPEKSVFNRWARCIGAFYLAVAALLIAVATMAVPSAETSATAASLDVNPHRSGGVRGKNDQAQLTLGNGRRLTAAATEPCYQLEEPMQIARVFALSVIIAAITPNAAPAAERRLSGSELLRAERCAGYYDCDDDGSWAADSSDRTAVAARAAELRLPSARDCVTQDIDAKAERPCPVPSHTKASR
jgi:hypothetical protein